MKTIVTKLKSAMDAVDNKLDTTERQTCEIFSKLQRQKMGQ